MSQNIHLAICATVENNHRCTPASNCLLPNVHTKRRRKKRTNLGIVPFTTWTVLVLCTLVAETLCSTLNPPHIVNPEGGSGIFYVGETAQLTCQGDAPLEWTYDNSTDTLRRVTIIPKHEPSASKPFSSTLTLKDIKHTDVGFYTCSYEGVDSEGDADLFQDFVHISVKDDSLHELAKRSAAPILGSSQRGENLSKLFDEDHLLQEIRPSFVVLPVGSKYIFPCIPTWPEVNVEISHEINSTHPIYLNKTNYSPYTGYTIPSLTQQDNGKHFCKATYKNKTETKDVTLHLTGNNKVQKFPPRLKIFNKYGRTDIMTIYSGEEFFVQCYTEQKTHYTLNLTGPATPDMNRVINSTGNDIPEDGKIQPPASQYIAWFEMWHVKRAIKADSGIYNCEMTIKKGSSFITSQELKVFDPGETYLNVTMDSANITENENNSATWVLNIISFPENYECLWNYATGEPVPYGAGKYKLDTDNNCKLSIYNATLDDAGNYTFIVKNSGENRSFNLSLVVRASPKVQITEKTGIKSNFMVNKPYEFECDVQGFPTPNVTWKFQKCKTSHLLDCEEPTQIVEKRQNKTRNGFISVIGLQAEHHGVLTCTASNSLGKALSRKTVIIVDFVGDEQVNFLHPTEIVDDDDVEITCAISTFYEISQVEWTKLVNNRETPISTETGFEVENSHTKWSQRQTLKIKNVNASADGEYRCKAKGSEDISADFIMQVLASSPPQLRTTLNNTKISLKMGTSIKLECDATGKPNPPIEWTWEGLTKDNWPNDLQYSFSDLDKSLILNYVPDDASGKYECTAKNRVGVASAFLDISVTGNRTFSVISVVLIICLVLTLIGCGGFIARYNYRQRKLQRFLKQIAQKDFYSGAVENINPELNVTDQAYLLPYDSTWEFPKDRIKFGIQLGSGAFGRVVRADAFGILDSESMTTVAVKMVKPNADESHFKALMSELKIMIHLGKHINVVNLLGACTKHLAKKKELLVIVEYCKYGSLLSYLHRNKRTFINQLDPAKGTIDTSLYRPIDCNSQQSHASRLHYATLTFTDPGNSRKPASNGYRTLEEFVNNPTTNDPPTPTLQPLDVANGDTENGFSNGLLTPNRRSAEHYVPESQVESACTGMSYLSNGATVIATDGTTQRRSSCGSQSPDFYRGDYQAREVKPITTTDLLSWAFQIARGMEYLASRKVLHGDLAARNVLLAENNVVKICDFGLAKEMYKDYKYKKKSEGVLLPVKWMAIESIYYGIFSTQSDCWSFGVVLWELFTLGKTPYPGMDADERFYKRISEGYRMEKPPLAPSCVYDIMLESWAQEPTERPSFSTLADRIGDMMEDSLRNHYIDLNQAYMKINQAYMSTRTDYLLQMGQSDFLSNSTRATPERQYQNIPEELDSAGYLKPISPNAINVSTVSPLSPDYKNIQPSEFEPSCSLIANNSGYMYVKAQLHPTDNLEEQPRVDEESGPLCQLQIRYSPDIKDVYGLRDDSASPDRNSFTDSAEEQNNPAVVNGGINGIRGVDNMNYVPNHLLFTKVPKNEASSPDNTDENVGELGVLKRNENDDTKRQKRQKNDSGLGSIDSSHFDRQSSSDSHRQPKEFSDFQEQNGYVSHQNIVSLS